MTQTLNGEVRLAPLRLNPQTFHQNLDALRETHTTDLADALQVFDPAAAGWQPAVSRDGTLSFQRTGENGAIEWFGRTSIPRIRAAALLKHFDAGPANALLPGIGQGIEAAELLRKLGTHQAVFVCEQSPEPFALALRLHDYAEYLRRQRLVLMITPASGLAAALRAWMRRFPGHLCPDRILVWPWQELHEIAEIRSSVECAYASIESQRQSDLAEVRCSLADRAAVPQSLGIFSLHARDESRAIADALAGAAQAAGLGPVTLDIRGPGDMHTLARARRLADRGPVPHAILLDIARGAVADLTGPAARVACWFTPGADPRHVAAAAASASGDLVFVTDSRLASLAAGNDGAASKRVRVLPPICLAEDGRCIEWTHRNSRAVMVMNLPPDTPEAHGVRLPTHVAIWQHVTCEIGSRPDRWEAGDLEGLIGRAERQIGSHLPPEIRQQLISGLTCVLQSALCQSLYRAVSDAGMPVEVFGSGWPEQTGALPLDEHRRIVATCAVVIHADMTGQRTTDALLAAGAGAVLLARRTPLDAQSGGLATLLKPGEEYLTFGNCSELVRSLRRLRSHGSPGQELTSRAVQRCRRDHSASARLREILTILSS